MSPWTQVCIKNSRMTASSRPHHHATPPTLCVLSTCLRTHNRARHTFSEELCHVNERAVSDRRSRPALPHRQEAIGATRDFTKTQGKRRKASPALMLLRPLGADTVCGNSAQVSSSLQNSAKHQRRSLDTRCHVTVVMKHAATSCRYKITLPETAHNVNGKTLRLMNDLACRPPEHTSSGGSGGKQEACRKRFEKPQGIAMNKKTRKGDGNTSLCHELMKTRSCLRSLTVPNSSYAHVKCTTVTSLMRRRAIAVFMDAPCTLVTYQQTTRYAIRSFGMFTARIFLQGFKPTC